MSTAPTPIAGGGGTPGSLGQTFNTAYYNSWPPAKQPLFNGRPGAQGANLPALSVLDRLTCVQTCIANGILIDEEIDYDPDVDVYTIMYMREFVYGQQWEPAGTGNVTSSEIITPGLYSGTPPVGTPYLIVSTDPAKFPPYPVPVIPPPLPPSTTKAANPIGARVIPEQPSQPNFVGDVFRCAVPNDGYGIGETWDGTSGQFFGEWTKQALLAGMMIVWTKTK